MEDSKVTSLTDRRLKVISQSGQPATASASPSGAPKPRLLDRVREAIRTRHYSHKIGQFLSSLARDAHVSASTQNQALNAMLFLYRQVLEKDIGYVSGVVRAKRPHRLPVVLTRQEVKSILGLLEGTERIIATLLYGAGLRLMECMR